jgi:methylthioribose-1-phosphate isomerase
MNILLHGDMGPLSCGLVGTGFAVVQSLVAAGTAVHVYVTEGGRRSDGARLSAPQLAQLDIPHTVVADAAVAWLLDSRPVDFALIRADTVFANGDCAGPLGSANVARLCAGAGVPAYACATSASIEPHAEDASGVALEVAERGRIEPLTDVAPAALLAGLVSERGVLRPPFAA